MKNLILVSLFTFLVLAPSLIFAQSDAEKNEIKTLLNKIFEVSKGKNVNDAAGLLAYTGDDEAKNLKQPFDLANSNDQNAAKRLLKKIKALLDISDSNAFTDFGTTNKKGISLVTLSVSFKSGAQTLTSVFSFVNINGKYLLAYVD